MLPLFALAAAAGLAKGMTVDQDKEDRDRHLAAETQRMSPWTKLKAGPIQEAHPWEQGIGWGIQGLGMQQSMANEKAEQKLNEEKANWYHNGANIWGNGASAGPDPFPAQLDNSTWKGPLFGQRVGS